MTEPTRARFWLSRLIVSLEVLFIVVGISWLEPESLTAKAIAASGSAGWVLLAALGVFCLIAIADVVINDLMPRRFVLRCALRWRHLGFMGMALLLGVIGVLVVFKHGFTTVLFAYWINAAFAVGITFLDAFSRLRVQ